MSNDENDRDAADPSDRTDWSLRFLGVGSSLSKGLGTAAAVLEHAGQPQLLIDCGHGTPLRYGDQYGCWPGAIFVTHVHLDNVGGLEQLYDHITREEGPPTRLYVPSEIIHLLHQRIGSMDLSLADDRSNFWDAFQVVPVSGGFWHAGQWFDVFEARHHAPRFAFGLRLAGRFLFSGDTRPIPELLRHYGNTGERLFHECALEANASHTGWADIKREYEPDLRNRMVLYHYESAFAGDRLEAEGSVVAHPGECFPLQPNFGRSPGRDANLRLVG